MATWRKTVNLALTLILAGMALHARQGDTIESLVKRIHETAVVVPKPRPFHVDLAREVATVTRTLHYSRRRMDRATSKEWFDEFFAMLDRNRTFLLASDIDEFRNFERTLATQVYRSGRIQFAFDVYARLLQRIKQWAEYAVAHLDDDFDFTKEETIVLDRRKEPWAKDIAELEELWRKRLKNSLLLLVIEREMREERRTAKAADGEALKKPEPKVADGEAPKKPEPKVADGDAPAPEAGGKEPVAQAPDAAKPEEEPDPKLTVLKRYEQYLTRRADVSAVEVLEMFLTSLTHIYDPHSTYMAPATNEDFNIDMRRSLTGIGARLTTEDGYVKVIDILPGGPAERDGRLKPGDRIVAVAQQGQPAEDVIDKPITKVVQKIRGEKGTTILLTILEKDTNHKTIIDLVRDVVKLEDGSAKSEVQEINLPGAEPAKGKVAVIYLPSFYRDFQAASRGRDFKSSGNDIRRLITEAGGSKLDGVILDLRANGGGALEEAIAIAGLFFGEGPVVQVREVVGRPRVRFDRDLGTAYDGALVVLVDKSSASASEIVAAALQDYHRAVVVGDASTHGKGTVQQKMNLNDRFRSNPQYASEKAGALKLTLAKYYRVTGGSTQLRGVVPDVVLPSYTDHMEMGEAKIPHAMPWDEIQPARFSCKVDVRPYLPELRKRSEARRAADPDFQQMVADINHYGERRKRKTLSLNRDSRRTLIQEEEEWSKKLREARLAGKNRRKQGGKPKEGTAPKKEAAGGGDLVLKEALAVLADMISLSHDPDFKAVAANDAALEVEAGDLENELQ